jgi:transcriptional regulator with XRE-family HTH domain
MVDFEARRSALGAFIRSQREMANLSLRQMAALADISNPYLSQIERGLHEPSVHVLRSIARALNLSAETLLAQAGLLDGSDGRPPGGDTVEAIRSDTRLTDQQKHALLAVYRSYCAGNEAAAGRGTGSSREAGVKRPGARREPEHR